MILYTPMQLELVLDGLDQMTRKQERIITIDGISVLVQKDESGCEKIVQLLSTNPADYLRADLHPGSVIRSN